MTWLSLGNPDWLSEPCSHCWTNPRQCLSFSPAGWADWPLGPVPLTPNSTEIGQKHQAPLWQREGLDSACRQEPPGGSGEGWGHPGRRPRALFTQQAWVFQQALPGALV